MRSRGAWGLGLLVATVLGCATGAGGASASSEAQPDPRIQATYEPSPPEVVAAMLALAEVGPDDRLLDLGSGDGRLVIAAAREHGAEAVGVELDPALVARSREAIASAGLSDRARIVHGDLHEHPLAGYTVITLFLWPSDNQRLHETILREALPGSRVVSHDHDMEGWAPDRVVEVASADFERRYGEGSTLYLWIVPARFEGCWADESTALELRQGHQVLTGTIALEGRSLKLDAGRARGHAAALVARDDAGSIELELRRDGARPSLEVVISGRVATLRPCPDAR